jgi:hypothetical protein
MATAKMVLALVRETFPLLVSVIAAPLLLISVVLAWLWPGATGFGLRTFQARPKAKSLAWLWLGLA